MTMHIKDVWKVGGSFVAGVRDAYGKGLCKRAKEHGGFSTPHFTDSGLAGVPW